MLRGISVFTHFLHRCICNNAKTKTQRVHPGSTRASGLRSSAQRKQFPSLQDSMCIAHSTRTKNTLTALPAHTRPPSYDSSSRLVNVPARPRCCMQPRCRQRSHTRTRAHGPSQPAGATRHAHSFLPRAVQSSRRVARMHAPGSSTGLHCCRNAPRTGPRTRPSASLP